MNLDRPNHRWQIPRRLTTTSLRSISAFVADRRICSICSLMEGVLFNESIRGRHIRFWLIVIVVRNEIFHCVIREELFHFARKAAPQAFLLCARMSVRSACFRDHVRHGKRVLPEPVTPSRRLVCKTGFKIIDQFFNRSGLIPRGLIFRNQFKRDALYRLSTLSMPYSS